MSSYHNCIIDGLENLISNKVKRIKTDLYCPNNTNYERQVSSFLLPTYNDTSVTVTRYYVSCCNPKWKDYLTSFE